MKQLILLLMVIPLVLASAVGVASAQRTSGRGRRTRPTSAQVEQARTLFMEGQAHYSAGRLHEALDAFLRSWRAVPNPQLAYNVARTYERIGDGQNGIVFYRHYLRNAPPDAPDRAEVEHRIAELEAMAQRQRDQLRTLPPSSDQLAQEARTFFERGLVMYRRREFAAAMAAFVAAYNYTRPNPPPEVVYNVAMTAERLEQWQDAIDFMREYARMLPRGSAERAQADERVAELRRRREAD